MARECGEAARTYGAILYLWIDGKPFYFSHKKIAETAGLSVYTVKRHIETLKANRWIVDAGRKNGRRTHTYELPYPRKSILKQGFYRFPLSANNITGWSKCVVLSIICWRCDKRDTGTLRNEEKDRDDERGVGIDWLVSHGADCGLRQHQVEHAFAALRGIRKGNHSAESLPQIIHYDSETLKVTIPPSLITGKSDDSIQCPTIPVSPTLNTDTVSTAQADTPLSQNAQADAPIAYIPSILIKQKIIKPKPLGLGLDFFFLRRRKQHSAAGSSGKLLTSEICISILPMRKKEKLQKSPLLLLLSAGTIIQQREIFSLTLPTLLKENSNRIHIVFKNC